MHRLLSGKSTLANWIMHSAICPLHNHNDLTIHWTSVRKWLQLQIKVMSYQVVYITLKWKLSFQQVISVLSILDSKWLVEMTIPNYHIWSWTLRWSKYIIVNSITNVQQLSYRYNYWCVYSITTIKFSWCLVLYKLHKYLFIYYFYNDN